MQIPHRKGGKYTHLKLDPHITEAKFNELKNQLDKLTKISRPRAIEEVKRLAALGDFSENAEYQLAKGRLRGINQRILELEEHLKMATVIKPKTDYSTVQLGHRVTVEALGQEKTYLILGPTETDPTKGIISHLSPLGAALLGHRVGDKITIQLKDKLTEYKIVEIK